MSKASEKPDNVVSLGQRIREARVARGWSQQRLADEAGSVQQTIDRIEKGAFSRALPSVLDALNLSDPTRGGGLQAARVAAGFKTAAEAARTFGWVESTYFGHENGSRGLSVAAAQRYADAFNADWTLILDPRGRAAPAMRNWLVRSLGGVEIVCPGSDMRIAGGRLEVVDHDGRLTAVFGEAAWAYVLEQAPSEAEHHGAADEAVPHGAEVQ